MNRPKRNNEEIMSETAKVIAKKVLSWTRQDYFTEEDVIDALCKVLPFSDDGYELAKEMEDEGFDADSELVSIMEGASWELDRQHRKAVKQWVKDNDIRPKLKEGDEIHIQVRQRDRTKYDAIIAEVREETAEYMVAVPDLGHIKEGLGTHGYILRYEWVEEQLETEEIRL